VLQPDFSTASLIVATAGVMFFLAGADLKQLIGGTCIAATTFGVLVMNSAHGRDRVTASSSCCLTRLRLAGRSSKRWWRSDPVDSWGAGWAPVNRN